MEIYVNDSCHNDQRVEINLDKILFYYHCHCCYCFQSQWDLLRKTRGIALLLNHAPLYSKVDIFSFSFPLTSPSSSAFISPYVRVAGLQAGIKPTALCSAINKENSIEFPLDFLHYLYNYYMVCALLSHAYHVISCDMTLWLSVMWLWCDTSLHSLLCSKSKIKEKEKKRKEI